MPLVDSLASFKQAQALSRSSGACFQTWTCASDLSTPRHDPHRRGPLDANRIPQKTPKARRIARPCPMVCSILGLKSGCFARILHSKKNIYKSTKSRSCFKLPVLLDYYPTSSRVPACHKEQRTSFVFIRHCIRIFLGGTKSACQESSHSSQQLTWPVFRAVFVWDEAVSDFNPTEVARAPDMFVHVLHLLLNQSRFAKLHHTETHKGRSKIRKKTNCQSKLTGPAMPQQQNQFPWNHWHGLPALPTHSDGREHPKPSWSWSGRKQGNRSFQIKSLNSVPLQFEKTSCRIAISPHTTLLPCCPWFLLERLALVEDIHPQVNWWDQQHPLETPQNIFSKVPPTEL